VSGQPFFDLAATLDLRGLSPPWSYLDFETIGFAVPQILGTRPYEQWPFQWSLHVEQRDGTVHHVDYLAVEDFGDFETLSASLLNSVPETGPVFAYNASFEKAVLERLANRSPNLAFRLRNIVNRLVDLLPVTQKAYYHPAMKGSWSIKAVLPTIAPDMAYEGLEEVKEGEGAQLAFLELQSPGLSTTRRELLIRALKRYCHRDTWGLVLLRRHLCAIQ
jgi:hypothetical protein